MALVKCAECGREISNKAAACPGCGAPLKAPPANGCTSGCALILIIIAVFVGVGYLVTPDAPPAPAAPTGPPMTRNIRVSLVARQAFTNEIERHYETLLGLVAQTNVAAAAAKLEEFQRHELMAYKDVQSIALTNRQTQLLAQLKTLPAGNTKQRFDAYKELAKLFPDNQDYASQMESLRSKLAEENQKQRRQELFRSQFSDYDGSYRPLVQLVKKAMHDPSSFEHVETKWRPEGEEFVVTMTYRGKNGFGALRLNSIEAKFDLSQNTVQVLKEGQ